MNKSPEEYFVAQDFNVSAQPQENFTQAEQAFIDKYLGADANQTLQNIGLSPSGAPHANSSAAKSPSELANLMDTSEDLTHLLHTSPELLMVAFFLGKQEFVIPTIVVQEVIRALPIAKLPAAPSIISGVINLRGKITPLIRLRETLGIKASQANQDQFMIICRRKGIQVGIMIERIHTMYRVPQTDIDWTIENQLGGNLEVISGLMKLDEQLIGIISIDHIIDSLLS